MTQATRLGGDFRLLNASELMRQGRPESAAPILRALVKDSPRLAQAHRLLGVALHELGDLAGAEDAFRRALALEPGLIEAATGLSELLRAQGRAEEAVAVLAPLVTPATTNLSLLSYFGHALQSVGRLGEATAVFRRAADANPASAVAEHNLAGALIEAKDYDPGAAAIERAFAKGLDAPETWLQYARALTPLGRTREAETAYGEVLKRRPGHIDAIAELAELAWLYTGDERAARAVFAEAARRAVPSTALLHRKARLLEYLGDLPGAYEAMNEAIRLGETAAAHVTALQIAVRIAPERAEFHALRALALGPEEPDTIAAACQSMLATGRPDEAEIVATKICRHLPTDQYALALLATAWRLLGDPRYRDLYDYGAFVRSWRLDTPTGWSTLESYLDDLRAALLPLHTYRGHPVGQSLRHGSQTFQDLARSEAPVFKALFEAIDGPIRRHLEAVGPGDDPHRRRATGGYRIAGLWSVKLPAGGYHIDHVHPSGWLSSALHIALPQAVETPPAGWLKFGEPGIPTLPSLGPDHFVRPEPGRLVLFPSYMWHGTAPFSGDEDRLTVAFDIMPG